MGCWNMGYWSIRLNAALHYSIIPVLQSFLGVMKA